jgi:hypothetical protein
LCGCAGDRLGPAGCTASPLDENYVLRDGDVLRVPALMMDSSTHDVHRAADAAVHDGFGGPCSRPGYRFTGTALVTDAEAARAASAAYDAYEQSLTAAWKLPAVRCPADHRRPGPPGDVSDADAREQAYRDHEAHLQNVWRTR